MLHSIGGASKANLSMALWRTAPELKAVTIDLEITAPLMPDPIEQTCSQERRPREHV